MFKIETTPYITTESNIFNANRLITNSTYKPTKGSNELITESSNYWTVDITFLSTAELRNNTCTIAESTINSSVKLSSTQPMYFIRIVIMNFFENLEHLPFDCSMLP